jgi:hypothetical protein
MVKPFAILRARDSKMLHLLNLEIEIRTETVVRLKAYHESSRMTQGCRKRVAHPTHYDIKRCLSSLKVEAVLSHK